MKIAFGKSYSINDKDETILFNDVLLLNGDNKNIKKEPFKLWIEIKKVNEEPQKKYFSNIGRKEAVDKILEYLGISGIYQDKKNLKENIEYFDLINGRIEEMKIIEKKEDEES